MASKYLKSYRLDASAIYCTSEPCPMCLAAISFAGIESCYFIADRHMAGTYGFDDSLLYDELSKPISNRKMHIVQQSELHPSVDKLFKLWKKKGLPIC
ncbi:MAG: nucleoside deaminase [Legionella sp.]|nr:nucleoside deaminase [Legionella sp.]